MKRIICSLMALLALGSVTASAEDFFSTDPVEKTFTFGARIGINTSNRTMDKQSMMEYNRQNWGTGFDVGFLANINFRNYLTIQPGVFFETRNGNYSIANIYGTDSYVVQNGDRRTYNLTIPVLASVHFNITDDIRWDVEAGPYVSFVMGSKIDDKLVIFAEDPSDAGQNRAEMDMKPKSTDFGLKFGTGLRILDHYYVGVHYMAGLVDGWKDHKVGNVKYSLGGCTKAWVFTVGYDF